MSTIKHAHHAFDVDKPGKDSWTHRQAGASEVLVASANRFALMHELRGEPEWSLPQLLDKLTPVDLVIVEGFKRCGHPKVEVSRAENGKPYLWPDDPDVVGLACDAAPPEVAGRAPPPWVGLDDIASVTDMLLRAAQDVATVRARLAAQTS